MTTVLLPLGIHAPYDRNHLDRISRLGLSRIQLRLGPGFPLTTDRLDHGEAKRATDNLAQRGITVASLGCYRNLLSADAAEARSEQERLRRVMRLAAVFEAPVIGVFAGRDPDRSVDENLPTFARVWGPLAAEAEDLGLTLAFENCTMLRGDPPRSINIAHTPWALERMFDALPSPALGLELDPSHLVRQQIDVGRFVERFGGHVRHVHAKDHEHLDERRQRHGILDPRASRDRLPGCGEVDFPALFRALAAVGYRGDVTLEVEDAVAAALPADGYESTLSTAVSYLRDALRTATA